MKKLLARLLVLLSLIMFTACGETKKEDTAENSEMSVVLNPEDNISDVGYEFEDGTLTVTRIYYTVLDVGEKQKCVYQEPWISYMNNGEIKDIIIDADMVYTTKNILTGKEFSDLSKSTGDFQGGGVLFGNMDSLESLTIKRLNLDKITDISDMFANNENLKSVDVTGLCLSGVKDISYLFFSAKSLNSIDLNGLDTASVIKAEGVLENCASLQSVGVSGWDTSNIKNLHHFFSECKSLSAVDLSGWTIDNADVSGMFWGCDALSSINLTNVNLTDTIMANPMFDEHNSLPSYMFTKDWVVEDVQPISEDVYDFIVVPMIGSDILFIEYVYYTKEVPKWYKEYVVKVQSVEDCISFQSSFLDIYIKDEGQTDQFTEELTLEDIQNVVMDNLSKMRDFDEKNATEEERKEWEWFFKSGDALDIAYEVISKLLEAAE
ncbi:MAG: DUF285 domain-containing protein [Lachnospiraceae bacterium]|nr:DUF285 domain-containing protein [Lachnospiraceae bacterium]